MQVLYFVSPNHQHLGGRVRTSTACRALATHLVLLGKHDDRSLEVPRTVTGALKRKPMNNLTAFCCLMRDVDLEQTPAMLGLTENWGGDWRAITLQNGNKTPGVIRSIHGGFRNGRN